MENKTFTDKLISVGAAVSNNRYLGSIRDAFVALMPFTIAGSIAVLWSNVIVNDSTGLGAVWHPIMALSFLNPVFDAINFCTLGCISLIVAFLLSYKLAEKYEGLDKLFVGAFGVSAFISILLTSETIGDTTVSGIFSSSLGSNGLFTAMFMAIFGTELFRKVYSIDKLKIHMPDQVPPQIARSFEQLIPAFISLVIIGLVNLLIVSLTGEHINDLVARLIQAPLTKVGGSYLGFLVVQIIVVLLWSVGLHGDNIVQGVMDPIKYALTMENIELVTNGQQAVNILNNGFARAFWATGGTGMILGLTIAMLIKAKRADNRAIARIAFIPNLFNIGEVDMFGFPVVLNPSLIIPFIIAPLVCGSIGWALTAIGFCPIFVYDVPWTMPPLLIAFVATGGSWQAVVTQLLCIAVSVLIYLPFVPITEKAQNLADEEKTELENGND